LFYVFVFTYKKFIFLLGNANGVNNPELCSVLAGR
jgi:hypothetical protein